MNFNPAGTNFGQRTSFPNNEDSPADPSTFLAALPAAGATPTLAGLDWTPSASSPLRTRLEKNPPGKEFLATFPARVHSRVQAFLGGALQGTTYRGAADPNGTKWWAGWTNYARN